MVPKAALDYIKQKRLAPAFSYKDVWNEEHASAFTVAKAMQVDVLSDIKGAVETAIENGETFESFKKNLKPKLVEKGWWGRKTMTDPLTGHTVDAQLGSDRRLRTIYSTNLRSAYQKGVYDRTMDSPAHPYLMYRIGPSKNHREPHLRWNGLILPKDAPFWNIHFPPNGYGCKCYATAVSEARKTRYEKTGIPIPARADGTGAGTLTVKTEVPKTVYKQFYNERKGSIEHLPKGITPGFGWNPGQVGRVAPVFEECLKKVGEKNKDQFDLVAKCLVHNQVFQDSYTDFVMSALDGKARNDKLCPVGFVDQQVSNWLEKKNIKLGEARTITLRAGLISGQKADRHASSGDSLSKIEWVRMIDYLLDADVYYDAANKTLIYAYETSAEESIKIAVAPAFLQKSTLRSASIRSVYKIGLDEIARISKLEKIK